MPEQSNQFSAFPCLLRCVLRGVDSRSGLAAPFCFGVMIGTGLSAGNPYNVSGGRPPGPTGAEAQDSEPKRMLRQPGRGVDHGDQRGDGDQQDGAGDGAGIGAGAAEDRRAAEHDGGDRGEEIGIADPDIALPFMPSTSTPASPAVKPLMPIDRRSWSRRRRRRTACAASGLAPSAKIRAPNGVACRTTSAAAETTSQSRRPPECRAAAHCRARRRAGSAPRRRCRRR